MLYRVALFVPLQHERGWSAVDVRTVGTARAAELCAESLLRPHARTETRYSAGVTRGAFVEVHHSRKGVCHVDCIEAPVRIVPSVGDLGVTP